SETVQLFEVATGKVRTELRVDGLPVGALRFSADSLTLASAWDPRSEGFPNMDLELPYKFHVQKQHRQVGQATHSSYLYPIYLWDLTGNKPASTLAGHRGRVDVLRFASNDRILVSESRDHTALVWDLAGPRGKQESKLTQEEMTELWSSLAGEDAAR